MEALKLNEALFENKEFIEFLDSILQKKLNSYNLELLIQCERQGNTEDKTLAKVKELKTIRKDIKELKNLNNTEKLASIISESNYVNSIVPRNIENFLTTSI